MKASTKSQTSPFLTGVITVAAATIVPGLLLAFSTAYLSIDSASTFRRDGIFHVGLIIVLTQTLCNLTGYTVTLPFYSWFHLPRVKRAVVTHAIVGTLLATLSYYLGLPAIFQILLPIGTLSYSGFVEIGIATTLAAALPYLTSTLLLAAIKPEPAQPLLD